MSTGLAMFKKTSQWYFCRQRKRNHLVCATPFLFGLHPVTSYDHSPKCASVTEQTGAWPPGTFTYDPTISFEGNRFLLTRLQLWGDWEHFCSEPSSPTRPRPSRAPQRATSRNHVQKFPIPLSVPQPLPQTGLPLLWKLHFCVSESPSSHSSSLLQDLGCPVLSLHSVVQGNMCRVTLGHGGVQGGTCPKRVASLYVLQRSKSLQLGIPGHSSAPSISHKSMLAEAGPHTAPSALSLHPFSPHGRIPL